MIQAATDRFLLPTVTRSEAQLLRCWGQGRSLHAVFTSVHACFLLHHRALNKKMEV